MFFDSVRSRTSPRGAAILLLSLALTNVRPASLAAQAAAQPTPQVPVPIPDVKAKGGDKTSPSATTSPGSNSQGGETKSASGRKGGPSPLDHAAPPPKIFARPRIGLALGGGGAVGFTEVGVLQWFEENHIPVDVVAGTSMGCMISSLYSVGHTPAELRKVINDRVFASIFSFSNSYTSRSFRRREDTRDLPNGVTIGLKHGVSFRNAVLVDQGLNAFLDRQFLRYDDRVDFNTLPIPLRCISTDLNEARAVTFARGSIPDAVRASVSLPAVFQPFEMDGHEYVDGGVLVNLPTATVKDMGADVVLAVSLPLQPVAQGSLNSLLGVLQRSFSVAIEAAERDQRKLANVVIMPDITGFNSSDYLKINELADLGYKAAEAQRSQLLPYAVSDEQWQDYLSHRAGLMRGPAGPVLRVRIDAPTHSATLAVQRLFAPLVNQPVDTAKIEAILDQIRADGAYDADYTVGYETSQQFAAHQNQPGALPADTVNVATALRPDQLEPATATEETLNRPQGAPNPKVGTGATSNQPGTPRTGSNQGNPDTSATRAGDAAAGDSPEAQGLAATRGISAASLSDVARRPIILVHVTGKKTGPPFLLAGLNVETQVPAFTRATVEAIFTDQDLGGYGSELRTHLRLGYLTDVQTEYYRPVNPFSSTERTVFAAPHIGLLRQPFPVYQNQVRLAVRQLQNFSTGLDLGLTNQRTSELRAGYSFMNVRWNRSTGTDTLPDVYGNAQRARVHYIYDNQDRALVPQFGFRSTSEISYLFSASQSRNAPQLYTQLSYAHRFSLHPSRPKLPKTDTLYPKGARQVFIMGAEGGTMFNRNVAQPFRSTLGGPLRLSASAIDEYRGTDYFLLEPALLRRIAQLPQPLGQNIYVGLGAEVGQMRSPDGPNITRADVYFGFVAETPLGVITLAPAIGTNGERKFIFTLGKVFF